MNPPTVRKYAAQIPVSIELLFDNLGPRTSKAVTVGGIRFYEAWPQWLVKEWLKRGHGLGRTRLCCRWPRPTVEQLRDERIERNAWLNEDQEDE